ncbi:hypothetical protein ACHHYP_09518 [Achlya hypogyna]|uniref:Uncharacterized protein n=1 Tax=Achlya hypogyna TaxID=1202772 RepID=A0A1V9YN66_ACHHY|nr:hypothetical protein ACHHYP_09518 [Achlya hypogyna]
MPSYMTTALRVTEVAVVIIAIVLLSHVFIPLKGPVKKSSVMSGSYTVGFMLITATAALVYSGGYLVLVAILRRYACIPSHKAQIKISVAFAVLFLGGTIMLADGSHYRYCHRSANVSCSAMEWSMTTLFVLSMIFGVDALLNLETTDNLPPENGPLTPNHKATAFVAATPAEHSNQV